MNQDQTIDRPFLEYWDVLESLEMRRRKGIIADDRHTMTLLFIDAIGPETFIAHARQTHALCEISRFYGVELKEVEDLGELLSLV